jgi:hygromycin-B 4-O-kinase
VTDEEACRFVAGRYGRRATDVRPLDAGEWSRAYAFVLEGREAVIRFGDHVEDFRKDQVMAGRSRAALPIPAVIEIGAAGDAYFAVSERAPGELLDGLDDTGIRAVLPGLLAVLDALRDLDVSGTEGYGLWTPDGTGPAATWAQALLAISQETPRVPGWRAALAASPVGAGPFDRGYARLAELAESLPDERHIIHGDLLNRNVLVQPPRITAVIDWGNALYGDWLYDAAWLIFLWPWLPQWQGIDITAELERHWAASTGAGTPSSPRRLRSRSTVIPPRVTTATGPGAQARPARNSRSRAPACRDDSPSGVPSRDPASSWPTRPGRRRRAGCRPNSAAHAAWRRPGPRGR